MEESSVPYWAIIPTVLILIVAGILAWAGTATTGLQANDEYFFRLLYECLRGACYGSFAGLSAWLANLWLWITAIGYALSVLALFMIVYTTVRLFQLREREEHFYGTLIPQPGAEGSANRRWQHIQSLIGGATPSEWKEAVIEADIMLEDVLTQQGYPGDGVGEKLKSATFGSVQDAWEAHKVRNQIAHQGSSFALSESLARRTIARFESVFRELKVI